MAYDHLNVHIDDTQFHKLKDKVAIITGGSSGIGLATAKLFANHGAHVYVGDVSPLPEQLPGIVAQKVDVTDWDSLVDLFETAMAAHGRIDIVFANAGISSRAKYLTLATTPTGRPLEPSTATLDLNLRACINTAALAMHYMDKPTGTTTTTTPGSIIITASAASYIPFGSVDYTVTKHALVGFVRALQPNLVLRAAERPGARGVRVNALAPLWTDTGLSSATPALLASVGAETQGAGVVARAAGVLAVDEARRGEVLLVSRGMCREIDGESVEVARALQRFDEGEVTGDVHWLRLYELTRKGIVGARVGQQ